MSTLTPGDWIALVGVLSLFLLALLGALGTLILKSGSHGAKLDSLMVSLPSLISGGGGGGGAASAGAATTGQSGGNGGSGYLIVIPL
jgi:hypothetical protein